MNEELMEYASKYQALRKSRAKERGGTFLPMELLREKATDKLHLSVSFSSTGFSDTYISQQVSLYRIVKNKLKWFIIPATIAKVLTQEELLKHFGDFLETENIDGEEF